MRISTAQIFTNAVDRMQTSQSQLAKLQEQIASGNRLSDLSDDPVAASQIVKIDRELAQLDKFDSNAQVSERRLELEEQILTDINNSTDKLRQLVIQAGNASYTDTDRATVAGEIEEITEYLAGLMNTKDAQGEYLFSGNMGTTQPFVKDADGIYQYQGDDGERMIQVGPETFIQANDSGRDLFESVTRASQLNFFGDNRATPAIVSSEITDEAALTSLTRQTGDLTLSIRLDGPANASPTVEHFLSLTDSAGNPVSGTDTGGVTGVALDDIPLDTADPVNNPQTISFGGVNMTIDPAQITDNAVFNAVPSATTINNTTVLDVNEFRRFGDAYGEVTVEFTAGATPGNFDVEVFDATGASIFTANDLADGATVTLQSPVPAVNAFSFDINSPAVGERVDIAAQADITIQAEGNKTNILAAAQQLAADLRKPIDGDEVAGAALQVALDLAKSDFDESRDRNLEVRTEVGTRLNTVESVLTSNDGFRLLAKEVRSELADVDYVEAISSFQLQLTALQAAQQSFAKVQDLSLFNFIR